MATFSASPFPRRPYLVLQSAENPQKQTRQTGGSGLLRVKHFCHHHSRAKQSVSSEESPKRLSFRTRAAENTSPTRNSILCSNCDGNGMVQCSQCKGSGVNSVDHFNGQFKAGAICWLCRGKKEMMCGDCNGAGFLGGFMSAIDE